MGAAINTPFLDGGPDISADGLALAFNSDRPGGIGQRDLYVATRATISDPFGSVVNLGPTINTPYDDFAVSLSADGLSLFFSSDRPGGFGGHDLWVSRRASLAASWGAPVNLGSNVNSAFIDYNPEISWDGSRIVFASTRTTGGDGAIYEAEVIPEPSTLALAACGYLLAALLAHRRGRAA
jgi:Tol biopolymer transport system component